MEPLKLSGEQLTQVREVMDKLHKTFADTSKAFRFHMHCLEEWKRAGQPGKFSDYVDGKLKAQPIRPLALAVAIRRVNLQ